MEGAYLAIHTDTLTEKEVSSMHYTLCWPGPVVWGAKTQHLTQHHHHHQRKKPKKKRERMGFSHCVMHHTVVSHTPKNRKECVRFGERSFEWSVTGD